MAEERKKREQRRKFFFSFFFFCYINFICKEKMEDGGIAVERVELSLQVHWQR
jgi:hypothetical protein